MLLGDSAFDNSIYLDGGPDVVKQLQLTLPVTWMATLLARDGSVASDLPDQVARLPADASHLVVSIGGNDALRHLMVLGEAVGSMADALKRLAGIRDSFAADYRDALAPIVDLGLPTWLCTIYEPRFPDASLQNAAVVALSVFNDVITRAASVSAFGLLDLRVLFDRDEDYANPIEPSVAGGGKIAREIVRLMVR